MAIVRQSTALALLVALFLIPTVAFAQAVPISDSLAETVVDSSGLTVPMTPPFPPVLIPESSPEPGGPITVPSRVIDFLEPAGFSQSPISDRLSISGFQVNVVSDDDPGGLPARSDVPNHTVIPASAREAFQPIRIEAVSDGDLFAGGESDRLTISLGYYGRGSGSVVFSEAIPEPTPEGTEPPLTFTISPTFFDVEEPSIKGGSTGAISDYFDILSPIQVTFLSSDDPTAYEGLPTGPNGSIIETPDLGGGVVYALNFRSDTEVPEPASFALVGAALLAASLFGYRRRVR